jgi:predicted transcriptional regulator
MRYIVEIMGDMLNENTQKVLQFIQENPGCHMRWIKKDLNMSMGSVRYHLNVLEQAGRIVSEKENLKKFYFPIGSFQTFERNLLKILNQDTAREIILFIIERRNPTQTDIVNSVKISHATANWHLTRLVILGIIYEEKDGKFKKYLLNGSHDNIVNLLKNFHSSIWDKWSNRLAELFLSSSSSEAEK